MHDGALLHAQFLGHARRRPALEGEARERLPGIPLEVALDEGEQLVEDVPVVFAVPLADKIAIGIGELSEELIGDGTGFRVGRLAARLLKGPDAVDRDLAQPGAEGAVAPPLERR